MYICMIESLGCAPETITTLLNGYTSMENKRFFKRRRHRQRDFTCRRGGGTVATEAQTGGTHLQPRDAGRLQKLQRGKAQILPWSLQQGLVLLTPHFWPSDTDFRLLDSRTIKE